MIILDTDILIDSARGVGEAVSCLQQIENNDALAISAVTEMELIIGCRNKNELKSLRYFLHRFKIISVNEEISDMATDLLKTYRLSHGLLIPDALIAGTAIDKGVRLVSKNRKDYRYIETLELLPYPEPLQYQY